VAPRRTWLDPAEHTAALLDGASALDGTAYKRRGQRRALIATLTFAGLRLGEALALRWRDVDLARGTITVRGGKKAAAARTVYIIPVLRDELRSYAAAAKRDQAALVFAMSAGKPHGQTNIGGRVLAAAIEKANEKLSRGRERADPDNLTPHSLRRTFASILFAIGEAPPYVMGQLGHTTAE
jgi:integrase